MKFLVSIQQQATGKVYGYVEVEAQSEYQAKKAVIGEVKTERQYTKAWADIGNDWCVYAVEV